MDSDFLSIDNFNYNGRKHINVVLVEPQKPENIGAAARAIVNMGLGKLILVRPRTINWELMRAMATRQADEVLDNLTIYQDLDEALADRHLVIGTTARIGRQRGPFYTPRQIAPYLLAKDENDSFIPTAILFGPERTGLSTDDIRKCDRVIQIPTNDPLHSSLNLAQTVLIIGYELLVADGGEKPVAELFPASYEEMSGVYRDLEDTLKYINFLPGENSYHWLMNFKKIFNRSLLTSRECNLWRGLCHQIRWAVDNSQKITDKNKP